MKTPTGHAIAVGINASLKRIAWAFGCAKKGSDEERQLRELLLRKLRSPTSVPADVRAPHGSRFRVTTDRRGENGFMHPVRQITQEDGELVDEITLDDWLHVERMDVNEWHVSIGDARIGVSVRHGRQPTVLVERGEYGPVHGDTRTLPDSFVEQRHDVVAMAVVKAWNKRVEQGRVDVDVDGIEGVQRVRGAYLEGSVGYEEAMLLLESGLTASASYCTPTTTRDPNP